LNSRKITRRRYRRLLPLALALILVAVLAACQSGRDQPAEAPAAVEAVEAEPAAPAEAAAPTDAVAEEAEAAAETEAEPAQAESAPEAQAEPVAGLQTFAIVPGGTEARFYIDEVLFGQDKTVIGVTSDVTGEIRLDPANPGASEIGPITINARDLTTDADRRNGAIRRFILQSDRDEFQYIVFTPTAIAGMPDAVVVGEPFTFQVTGDLTVRDVVRTETFEVTVTPASESELSGLAVTTVLYPDYGLIIPEVPSVTGVEDEVRLELEFSAAVQ
jgi:polyisoprenoid-binding protein YceI